MTDSTDGSEGGSLGVSWILVCTIFVISMQLGFSMLEVGSVRKAHRNSVLFKNVLDSAVSCICFWVFVEIAAPSIVTDEQGNAQYHDILFHWAFCATSVTICSGSMAERTNMGAYLAYCVLMSGIIYPIVAEAAWGGDHSLLSPFFTSPLDEDGVEEEYKYKYHDFAGSGVVHLVGGASALVGNCFLGRRIYVVDPADEQMERDDGPGTGPTASPRSAAAASEAGAPPRPPTGTFSRSGSKASAGGSSSLMDPHAAAGGTPGGAASAHWAAFGEEEEPRKRWQQEDEARKKWLMRNPPPPKAAREAGEEARKAAKDAWKKWQMRTVPPPKGVWWRRLDEPKRDAQVFEPADHLIVMGTFTLWVGWYGFNAGSTGGLDEGDAFAAGVAAWNTSLSAAAGGLGASLYNYYWNEDTPFDVAFMCHGVFAGLVAITASCDVAKEYLALIAGGLAGLVVVPLGKKLMEKARLDDVVNAVPVHACCGAWGVLFVAFCQPKCKLLEANGGGMEEQRRFCKEDFSMWHQLMVQFCGMLAILVWVCSTSFVLWFVFMISERIRAEEVQYLNAAIELLCNARYDDAGRPMRPPQPTTDGKLGWADIFQNSPVARRVCKECGWSPQGFDGTVMENRKDVNMFMDKLVQNKCAKVDTALEKPTRVTDDIVGCLGSFEPIRYLARLRLRVPPEAENSGLGASYAEGFWRAFEFLRRFPPPERRLGPAEQSLLQRFFAWERQRNLHRIAEHSIGHGSGFTGSPTGSQSDDPQATMIGAGSPDVDDVEVPLNPDPSRPGSGFSTPQPRHGPQVFPGPPRTLVGLSDDLMREFVFQILQGIQPAGPPVETSSTGDQQH